jgi:sugar lactone lactonase YvrE
VASPTATAATTATPSEPAATSSATTSASPSAAAGAPVEIVIGGGTETPANGLAAAAVRLQRPTDIAFDPDGSIWIVDGNAGMLIHVLADGTLADVTGGLLGPAGVAVTPNGTVYVADRGNFRIVKYDGNGGFDVAAGDAHQSGYAGDGAMFSKALFSQPTDLSSDVAGNLYIDDWSNQRVRWVDAATDMIDTLAGTGTAGFSGDSGPAKDAQINSPRAIAADPSGARLLIADSANQRLRGVDMATGQIDTIAGKDGSSGVYDPALGGADVPLVRLSAVAVDASGNIYLPVFWGNKGLTLERLDPNGQLTLLAGGGATTAAGTAPLDFSFPDILCLATDPASGDLLACSPDGVVYRLPVGSTVARP